MATSFVIGLTGRSFRGGGGVVPTQGASSFRKVKPSHARTAHGSSIMVSISYQTRACIRSSGIAKQAKLSPVPRAPHASLDYTLHARVMYEGFAASSHRSSCDNAEVLHAPTFHNNPVFSLNQLLTAVSLPPHASCPLDFDNRIAFFAWRPHTPSTFARCVMATKGRQALSFIGSAWPRDAVP